MKNTDNSKKDSKQRYNPNDKKKYTETYKIEQSKIIGQVASACLAVVSFFTTKKGFDSFVFKDDPVISTMISFAVQSLLLIISLNFTRVIDCFKENETRVKAIVVCILFSMALIVSSGFSYVFLSNYMYIETWNKIDKRHILMEHMRDGAYELENNVSLIAKDMDIDTQSNEAYNAFTNGLRNDVLNKLDELYTRYSNEYRDDANTLYKTQYDTFINDFNTVRNTIKNNSDISLDQLYDELSKISSNDDTGYLRLFQNRLNLDIRPVGDSTLLANASDYNEKSKSAIDEKLTNIKLIKDMFDELSNFQTKSYSVNESQITDVQDTLNKNMNLISNSDYDAVKELIKNIEISLQIKQLDVGFEKFIEAINNGFNDIEAIKNYEDQSESERVEINGLNISDFANIRNEFNTQDMIMREYLNAFIKLSNDYKLITNKINNSNITISKESEKIIRRSEKQVNSLNKTSSAYSRNILATLNPIIDSINYIRYAHCSLAFIAAGIALFLDMGGIMAGLLLLIFRKSIDRIKNMQKIKNKKESVSALDG